METLQAIKAFIARLAGAPSGGRLGGAPTVVRHAATDDAQAIAHRPRLVSGLDVDGMPVVAAGRKQTSRQRDGDEGEAFARRYLELAGLVFVAANVSYRDGELDLVMRETRGPPAQGTTLVFVEVRRRARDSHGGAAGSITREKRRRVAAAAAHYLVGLGLRALPNCRFDVVTIEGERSRVFRIDWIRDAFRDEG